MPLSRLKYYASRVSGRVYQMPVLVLMPHSRCNCRCVMCDIWRANRQGREITAEEFQQHLKPLQRLGVRWVVLSGGEPLMHSNLWALSDLLKGLPARITLLSTGILLKQFARQVCAYTDEVIVSLDGSPEVHNAIRRVPRAFEKLREGVEAVRAVDPTLRISARCVIQRENYFDIHNVVSTAREIGLDQISFLAADVSTSAFNRPDAWDAERVASVGLDREETASFSHLIEELIKRNDQDIRQGFIAESAEKLRRLPAYFAALNDDGEFPSNRCNAPWVSTVIETDGTVRPCFFHREIGNVNLRPLDAILNDSRAVAFRKQLDVRRDPICQKCVCTLQLSPNSEF